MDRAAALAFCSSAAMLPCTLRFGSSIELLRWAARSSFCCCAAAVRFSAACAAAVVRCAASVRVLNVALLGFPGLLLVFDRRVTGGLQLRVNTLLLLCRSRVEAGGTAERVGALGERGPAPRQRRVTQDAADGRVQHVQRTLKETAGRVLLHSSVH